MFEDIDSAANNLRDTKAGWVTRRDAVETLSKAAERVLGTLKEFSEEMDVDVRRAVDEALGKAAAILEGVTPNPGPAPAKEPPTLEELVRSCEKPNERTVEAHGDGYVIRVKLKNGRNQVVKVRPVAREDGVNLYQVYTVCGRPEEKAYGWALHANMKMAQGALALASDGDEERFVLTNCFLVNEVSPKELKLAVKEIAYFGDWIESKLSARDEF